MEAHQLEMNINEKKQIKKPFLFWYKNSCYIDSFLFLFISGIFNKEPNLRSAKYKDYLSLKNLCLSINNASLDNNMKMLIPLVYKFRRSNAFSSSNQSKKSSNYSSFESFDDYTQFIKHIAEFKLDIYFEGTCNSCGEGVRHKLDLFAISAAIGEIKLHKSIEALYTS